MLAVDRLDAGLLPFSMFVVIVEKNGAGTNLTLVWMTRRARNIQQFTSRAFFSLSVFDYLEKRDREKKRKETEEESNVLHQCSEFDLCQSKQSFHRTKRNESSVERRNGMQFCIFIMKSEWQVNDVLYEGEKGWKWQALSVSIHSVNSRVGKAAPDLFDLSSH